MREHVFLIEVMLPILKLKIQIHRYYLEKPRQKWLHPFQKLQPCVVVRQNDALKQPINCKILVSSYDLSFLNQFL